MTIAIGNDHAGTEYKFEIIKQLEFGHLSSKDLFKALPFSEEQINNTLKQMLERNIIEVTATNTYKLKHL